MAKQNWEVTLCFTETEGGPNMTQPWYNAHDITAMIRRRLEWQGDICDLKLTEIRAEPKGGTYY